MGEIQAPTLIVQGTADTFVPVESSRQAAEELRVEYLNPQSQEWQALVVRTVADWLTAS